MSTKNVAQLTGTVDAKSVKVWEQVPRDTEVTSGVYVRHMAYKYDQDGRYTLCIRNEHGHTDRCIGHIVDEMDAKAVAVLLAGAYGVHVSTLP